MLKKKGAFIKNKDFKPYCKKDYILNLIKNNAGNGYIRLGNFSNEIIWDGFSYNFPNENVEKKTQKGLYLFGMVRKDAKLFLKKNKNIKLPKKYPVNLYNGTFSNFEHKITATDINHAYWRIAFNLGIISENTYQKGLNDDFKNLRLAALSTLGSGKDYNVIKKGVVTNSVVNIGYNEDLERLYKAIRFTCYSYMIELMKLLGDDFVCYRTDCIYYLDTKENKKLVRDYLKQKKLEYKQLHGSKKILHEQD